VQVVGGDEIDDVADIDLRLVVAPVAVVVRAPAAAVIEAEDAPLAGVALGEIGEIGAVASDAGEGSP
jgi:hypothetical protein